MRCGRGHDLLGHRAEIQVPIHGELAMRVLAILPMTLRLP